MTDAQLEDLVVHYQAEQRVEEVIWFYRAVEKIHPQVIVEIGVKEGGNLKILSTHLDENGLCIGIDWNQEILWKMNDARCPVHCIQTDSHSEDTLYALKTILAERSVDVLFIDGSHSTEGMLADYADYGPLVRRGGIVAVHDIYYLKEVAKAWAQVRERYEDWYESARNRSSIGIGYVVMS